MNKVLLPRLIYPIFRGDENGLAFFPRLTVRAYLSM